MMANVFDILQLASQGLNIVLISRSPYKLQNVAAEIGSIIYFWNSYCTYFVMTINISETKYGVKARIIDVDFTGKVCNLNEYFLFLFNIMCFQLEERSMTVLAKNWKAWKLEYLSTM